MKVKNILKGLVLSVVLCVASVGCGSSEAATTTTSEEKTTVVVEETAGPETEEQVGSSLVNESKSGFDIVTTLNNIGQLENISEFTVSDSQAEFINDHLYLFPAVEEEAINELISYIDFDLDYAHMKKNPEKYSGTFAYLEIPVSQVVEGGGTTGDYSYITLLNSYDMDGNLYYIYYIGQSIDIVDGDYMRAVVMPIANVSYENLEGDTVLSVMMIASYAENYNDNTLSQYITIEDNTVEASEATATFTATTDTNEVTEVLTPRSEIDYSDQALATHGISLDTIKKIVAKYIYEGEDEYMATFDDYEFLFYFEDNVEEWNYKITEDEWGCIEWQTEDDINFMRYCISNQDDANVVLTEEEAFAMSDDDVIGVYGMMYNYEIFHQDDPGEGY